MLNNAPETIVDAIPRSRSFSQGRRVPRPTERAVGRPALTDVPNGPRVSYADTAIGGVLSV